MLVSYSWRSGVRSGRNTSLTVGGLQLYVESCEGEGDIRRSLY